MARQVFLVSVAAASEPAGFPSLRASVQRFGPLAAGFPSYCAAVHGFRGFCGRFPELLYRIACTRARKAGKPASEGQFPCTAIRKVGKPATRGNAEPTDTGQTKTSEALKTLAEKGILVWVGKSVRDPHQYYPLPDED